MRSAIMLFCGFALFIGMPVSATIINVPADQPTIQAGIDASVDGDTVLIADGEYTGMGNYDIDFAGNDIVVKSLNGPNATVIDCENNGRGFLALSGESSLARLEGLTVRNGLAQPGGGGAVWTFGSSPIIIDCIFESNHADNGGAVYINGQGQSEPTNIVNCKFVANTSGNFGGAIYYQHNNMTLNLTGCLFIGNESIAGSGACGAGSETNAEITNELMSIVV